MPEVLKDALRDPAITSEIYGHLDLDDMRRAVNKLSFKPTGSSPLKLVR